MIKHTLQDNLIAISIAKKDFSYRIPLQKIGNIIDWKIGEKESEGILIKNVSKWTLQLFTNKITEEKYIKQFKNIVQEQATNNSIDWDATFMAVKIQNEYNWLVRTNLAADEKITDAQIISNLKEKHQLK